MVCHGRTRCLHDFDYGNYYLGLQCLKESFYFNRSRFKTSPSIIKVLFNVFNLLVLLTNINQFEIDFTFTNNKDSGFIKSFTKTHYRKILYITLGWCLGIHINKFVIQPDRSLPGNIFLLLVQRCEFLLDSSLSPLSYNMITTSAVLRRRALRYGGRARQWVN